MLAGHSNVIAGNLGIGGGEWLFRAETGATTFSGILSYMAAPSAFDIIGTVVLDGAILELGDFAPSAMTLLNNDGTDAVQGSFLGLAEGSIIDWQGQDFSISYSGGDGNDVTLSRVSVTQPDSQVPLSNSLLLVAIGGLALVTVSGGRRRAE